MRHWTELGEAQIPGTEQSLYLYKGKDDFFIKISGGHELMSTRKHGSEDALGSLPCQRLKHSDSASVLIGGLGMGFTLAAVLAAVGPNAEVTVAELIPEVVEWNRGPLGDFSGKPIDDPRTRMHTGDVAKLLRQSRACFDVIALDVDNGPEGLTKRQNDWLYSTKGILAAQQAQVRTRRFTTGCDVVVSWLMKSLFSRTEKRVHGIRYGWRALTAKSVKFCSYPDRNG
jgi:spermidine synthase